MKKLWLTILITFSMVLGVGAISPALANGPTISLSDQGISPCTKPGGSTVWGSSGAFVMTKATDQMYWQNSRALHINYSNSYGDLLGCIDGYHKYGGTRKLSVSWNVQGSKLSSCSIGTSGASCTINSGATIATGKYSASASNTTGSISLKTGGNNYYAGPNGSVDYFAHTATSTFTYNAYGVSASTSNASDREL